MPLTAKAKHGTPVSSGFFSLFALAPTVFKPDFLTRLGREMVKPQSDWPNTFIPAGYTYLGQFIVHDISRLARGDEPPHGAPVNPHELRQVRTATLDLDSIYGAGGDYPTVPVNLDTGEMFLGSGEAADGSVLAGIDLPRDPTTGRARIGDDRNDENLLVAQLHLQFLKLHNFFVAQLRAKDAATGSLPDTSVNYFTRARRELQLSYQQVVLHDFLRRIIDPRVWRRVIRDNCVTFWNPARHEAGRIPVEFAAAAMRYGHSMVQHSYVIRDHTVTLDEIFAWSGRNNLNGRRRLPHRMHVDWRTRFFSPYSGEKNPGDINPSRRILPHLKLRRNDMPVEPRDLAAHNLLRGNELGLPDGQALVKHLCAREPELCNSIGLEMLDRNEVLRDPRDDLREQPREYIDLLNTIAARQQVVAAAITADDDTLIANIDQLLGPDDRFLKDLEYRQELADKTPLWFYILQESWVRCRGKRLGPLGSLIVAESLRALVQVSEPSVLHADWRSEFITPTLEYESETFLQMTDLLDAVGSD